MIVYPVIICFLLGNYAKESSAKFSREVIEDNNDGLEGNESALEEGNLSFGKKNDILGHLKIFDIWFVGILYFTKIYLSKIRLKFCTTSRNNTR